MKRRLDFSVFRASNPTLSPTNSNVFFEKFFQKVPTKVRVHSDEQHLLHDLCNDILEVKRSYFSPKVCTVAREVKFVWKEPSRRGRC